MIFFKKLTRMHKQENKLAYKNIFGIFQCKAFEKFICWKMLQIKLNIGNKQLKMLKLNYCFVNEVAYMNGQTVKTQAYLWPYWIASNMSRRMTKAAKWPVRLVKTQISLGFCPVWSESSLSAWRNIGPLSTCWAHSEDWSDWVDAQADLSLHWAHMSFCWFCHAAAHICWNCLLHNAKGSNYFLHKLFRD